MDLFKDIIHSILVTKKCVINDIVDQNDYIPFIVNRALSYHMDCIFYANDINLHHSLDKDMQYQYLLNSVRPLKRKFKPWQKQNPIDDLVHIKKYFGYSNNKAKQALTILTEDQLIDIRLKTMEGGVSGEL